MSGHLKWLPGILSSYNHIINNQDKPAGTIFSWGTYDTYEVCDVCGANKEDAAAGAVMVGDGWWRQTIISSDLSSSSRKRRHFY